MPAPRRSRLHLLAAAACLLPTSLPAQLPPLSVPKGQLRFDIGGRFEFWDQTYSAGTKLDAGADFTRDPATGSWLPGLGRAEADLSRITGAESVTLSLGKTSNTLTANAGVVELGAALGLTSRITIFGRVPIVRVRVQPNLGFDSAGASAGFNPADPLFGNAGGAAATNGFISQLDGALIALDAQIESGLYDANPAMRAEAVALLARGTTLQSDLASLLLGSTFLPIQGTAVAAALTQTIDSIRTRMGGLGTPISLTAVPALPTTALPPTGFEDYLTRAGGPIAADPLEPPIFTSIGDIEVGAGFALLNGKPPIRGFAVRSVLQGTVRLPTGKVDAPGALFDLGTGEKQLDLQADLVTDLMGSRFGARLAARYVYQLPGQLERRVTPPDQPVALAASLAAVERDPGEVIEGSFEPYFRIARSFSIVAGVRHWRKAQDKYSWAAGQEPLPDASLDLLAQDSKENATMLSLGLSLAHPGLHPDGRTGLPVDAIIRGQMLLGSTEGRVPARQSVVFEMRVYGRIF